MRQTRVFRCGSELAVALAIGFLAACGSSSHGDDDDDGGSSGEGGAAADSRGGTGGSSGGNGGTTAARAGSSNGDAGDGSGGAGGASSGSAGDAGAGTDHPTGGERSQGGSAGSGGASGRGGSSGSGPRPAFSPKVACDAPRWLTTVAQPVEATDPLTVTNGNGLFMVTYLTSEAVNATDTWGNTVVSMERDGLYPNPLENTVGAGTNTHVGQLAMGASGDALWLQDPGVLGSSADTTLRRWDQAARAWDAPHVVTGLRAFSMRATFLDDHDILVVGSIADELVSLVYASASKTWSDPEPIGSLGSAQPNWAATHVAVAADGAGNAAAVWANGTASGARIMRARSWVGSAVPLTADPMVQDFWDVAVVPAGGGDFEVLAGPQDETRGVIMQAWTLGYSAGTLLSEPVEAGRRPEVYYIGAGQPITALRDVDGELTVASVFWTDRPEYWAFRRTDGVWGSPQLLASGTIVANDNIGMGLRAIALDSGGHALAVTANDDDELMLRELEKGSSTWTDGIRIDTTDFRFNRRGVSLVLDGDEPVIYFSADDRGGGNVAWTACR